MYIQVDQDYNIIGQFLLNQSFPVIEISNIEAEKIKTFRFPVLNPSTITVEENVTKLKELKYKKLLEIQDKILRNAEKTITDYIIQDNAKKENVTTKNPKKTKQQYLDWLKYYSDVTYCLDTITPDNIKETIQEIETQQENLSYFSGKPNA